MKNSILQKLSKKYNMGGMMTDAQPIVETVGKQGIKTGLSRAFSNPLFNRVLGLGSGLLSTGAAGYEFFKGYGKNLPNMGVNVGNLAENSGLSSGYSMKQMGGVEPLPGGVVAPIPGSDAVEFMGNKHDESGMGSDSGIMVDANTEVEDGETMDQVTMKHGGNRDYFFSSHLKKGGKSYADMHKNILEMGGTQEDINMLARMQEKAAGRDPNQVAKLGGVMKYEEGGRIDLEEIMKEYPNYGQEILNLQRMANPEAYEEERRSRMNDRRPPIVEQKRRKLRNLQLFVDQGRTLTPEQQEEYNILVNDKSLNEGPISMERLEIPLAPVEDPLAYDPVAVSKFRMESSPYYKEAIKKERTAPKMSDEEIKLADSDENTYDAYLARTERDGTEMAMSEEDWNKAQKKEAARLARILNPSMPLEAKIGLGAQFIPTIGAMFTKQKDPEEFTYTPGFTSPIVPERVKGETYEAPTQDEARARLASAYTGEQRFLDTSGAGSATLSNRQALFAKKLQGEAALGAQESKDAITAENLTKKSQEAAAARNAQMALTASTANAQMAQKEADRKAAVDNANIQLRNMRENEKISNRINILTTLGQGIGTVMGDTMQYKADERVAKAQGLYGIYERDRLKTLLSGKINPKTGQNYTEQDIALIASGLS